MPNLETETDQKLIQTIKEERVTKAEECLKVCRLMTEDNGYSMRQACDKVGINSGTFTRYCSYSQTLMQQYVRARRIFVDLRFDQMLEKPKKEEFLDNFGRVDNGAVQLYKAHIANEQWAFSKIDPGRFGDKVEHNVHNNENKITRVEHVIIQAPDTKPALPASEAIEISE